MPQFWTEGQYERCSVCRCELPIPPLDLDIAGNVMGRKCDHCATIHPTPGPERWEKFHQREEKGGC
jgi:hypothetical protein